MTNFIPVRWYSLHIRVRSVAVGNLLISVYYLYLLLASFYKFDNLPYLNAISYGLSFLGMIIGSLLLYRENRRGKIVTQMVGALGIFGIIGYGCYGFTFLDRPGYSNVVVVNYTINYIWNIFLKYAYPIIAGFIILHMPNERLGLK